MEPYLFCRRVQPDNANAQGFDVVPYQGYLILLSADTLAAADLIGFNKSFNRNVKSVCWQCDCMGSQLCALRGFTLRTDEQYNEQSKRASSLQKRLQPLSELRGQQGNARRAARAALDEHMRSIGVRTFEHAFNRIPHFSVVRMVPRDLMHVELEGTLKSHLFGVLYMALCKFKWFSKSQFNAALKAWPFPKGSSRPDVLYDLPKGHLLTH